MRFLYTHACKNDHNQVAGVNIHPVSKFNQESQTVARRRIILNEYEKPFFYMIFSKYSRVYTKFEK
jgi:hypothetical protein